MIGPDGPFVGGAAQPKRMALLALLARAGERGITRDKVLGYFWPDAEEDRARRSLANAVWALRRDLGEEELFLPGSDLRLNPDVVTSDVEEFETAMATGDVARAATLYEGPFLDGFRLAGAPEFDRWMDSERSALAHRFAAAAEKLARAAEASGDRDAAVAWWRKVAAHDPLNSRLALGLMRALAAAGDRVGAVRHAQIYEALVDQELDLPPDREVVEFARQLRESPPVPTSPVTAPPVTTPRTRGEPETRVAALTAADTVSGGVLRGESDVRATATLPDAPRALTPDAAAPTATPETGMVTVPSVVVQRPSPEPTVPVAVVRRQWPRVTRSRVVASLAVVAFGLLASQLRFNDERETATPVLALGQITDYRADRSTELVKPLTDMLATALARCESLRVLSTARMYELTSRLRSPGADASPESYVAAARVAGATELLEGALYAVDDSTLRLDLRRIDLRTGNVRGAHSVVARGPFALADSGTARLVADFDQTVPPGSIADVTTSSLAAYRFYEEGMRAFYQDDLVSAERLFKAALDEDSTFASAAYYLAISYRQNDVSNVYPMLQRAVRLSARASDRERLTIRAHWEERASSPTLRATAESLLVRYPQEVEGHFFTGVVHVLDGDFLGARPYLERAIAMDSISLHGPRSRCTACEAFQWLISSDELADSLARGERDVRRWMRLQPRSGLAYASLIEVLTRQGRTDEAIAAWRERSRFAPGYEFGEDVVTRADIQAGKFEEADALMRGVVATGTPVRRLQGYWYLALSSRYQGRLLQSLEYARRGSKAAREAVPQDSVPLTGGLSEAQALQDLGRGREAAAVFEKFARWNPGTLPTFEEEPSILGRHRAWNLTHAATALASAGDTATLGARADTIQRYGSLSARRLHRDLHHYVRGLLAAARGHDDAAIAEFRKAISSMASGYTRTNYELARVLLRSGRPGEAVAVLQPPLHSGIEATSYYVTRVELDELLAQAWDSLGTAAAGRVTLPRRVSQAAAHDSAARHYATVARLWANGDPPWAARARQAEARARALRP